MTLRPYIQPLLPSLGFVFCFRSICLWTVVVIGLWNPTFESLIIHPQLSIHLSCVLSCSCLCSSIRSRDWPSWWGQPDYDMVDNQIRRGAKVTGFGSLWSEAGSVCHSPTKSIVIWNLTEDREPCPHQAPPWWLKPDELRASFSVRTPLLISSASISKHGRMHGGHVLIRKHHHRGSRMGLFETIIGALSWRRHLRHSTMNLWEMRGYRWWVGGIGLGSRGGTLGQWSGRLVQDAMT
jgi:hypothetical protein